MHVGFTGTQIGLTQDQRRRILWWLQEWEPDTFRHGDCIGADAEAHTIALALEIPVIIHPPLISTKRAFCKGWTGSIEPKDYLQRNREIVVCSDVLVACPKGMTEELRSGTWSTVRFARRCGKSILIIWPNGQTRSE